MKVSKGQSQPEIVVAAFFVLYMVLGRPFYYQVLIMTQVNNFIREPDDGITVETSREKPSASPELLFGLGSGQVFFLFHGCEFARVQG